MLKHAATGPSTSAGSHSPSVWLGGGSDSEAYLTRQAASAKADLQHASKDMVSALKQAASKQLQVEGEVMQTKASMQQAAQAMQRCVLPSLAAGVQSASESMSFAEQAVDTAAVFLADLVQQAVMASTSMRSKLKAADDRGKDLAASNVKLQGIQDSLHSELQAEQVTIPEPGSMLAARCTKSHSARTSGAQQSFGANSQMCWVEVKFRNASSAVQAHFNCQINRHATHPVLLSSQLPQGGTVRCF